MSKILSIGIRGERRSNSGSIFFLIFFYLATSLCFADKTNFTQEVLAVVIQNLMDITPLPTLLMRTVIQAISFYPRLIGFGMNILQRLILKQVRVGKNGYYFAVLFVCRACVFIGFGLFFERYGSIKKFGKDS